jgi:hypothetical protein
MVKFVNDKIGPITLGLSILSFVILVNKQIEYLSDVEEEHNQTLKELAEQEKQRPDIPRSREGSSRTR